MTWIDALATYIKELVEFLSPLRVVKAYERGVVFRFGIPVRVMDPGLRLLWPFKVEDVTMVNVAEETLDMMVQSVVTADDVAVTFSANLVFRVVDPVLYLCAVEDFNRSAEGYARIHLAQRARKKSWPELLADQRQLEQSIEGTMSTRLSKWGAEVVSFGFTDLTKARPFRLFSDPLSTQRSMFG